MDKEKREGAEDPKKEQPAGAKPAQAAIPPPNQYVPGEPKKGLAEVFRILKERRLLRKDLKEKGITKKKDFEEIAASLGLVLWKLHPFFIWWHHAWKALLAGWGLKTLVAGAAAALATVFLVSVITEEKGAFTINFTGDMLKAGFVLSETADFKHETSRLFADSLDAVNNITMTDIDPTVHEQEGSHNGKHYFAYTFFIKNRGKEASTYAWQFRMTSEIKDVSDAVWIMLFEDGKQVVYTRPTAEGQPEEVFGFEEPLPFTDLAYSKDQYYGRVEGGQMLYGIRTTPYATEDVVAQGLIKDVQPDEVHRYTVVLWVEGYDPECVDSRFGGYAKYEMQFDYVDDGEEDNIFSGIYRTEYEDYGINPDAGKENNTEDTPANGEETTD